MEHGLGTFESVETTRDAEGNVRKHYVGFKGYNLRELCHTAASELVANGADLQTVKTIMRHSRMTTTKQCLHEVPDNVTEAIDRVSKRRIGYSKEAEEANAEQGLLDRNPHLKNIRLVGYGSRKGKRSARAGKEAIAQRLSFWVEQNGRAKAIEGNRGVEMAFGKREGLLLAVSPTIGTLPGNMFQLQE